MRLGPQWMPEDIDGLPVCEGPASDDDLARGEQNRKRRAEGRLVAPPPDPRARPADKDRRGTPLGAENVFVPAPLNS